MEVLDRQGRIIWRAKPQKRLVMSRTAAAIMTNMLEGVIQEGTGKKARVLGRPVAGKTGTTDNYKDALFIGFAPTIAAGVWVGNDLGSTLGNRETGARAALPIWIEFMAAALSNQTHQRSPQFKHRKATKCRRKTYVDETKVHRVFDHLGVVIQSPLFPAHRFQKGLCKKNGAD